MGVPNYPTDLGSEMRNMRRNISNAFNGTSTCVPGYRPWSALTVSDVASAMWPSTTSNTFTSLQMAAGTRSHPAVGYLVKIVAPAAGSEWRVTDSLGGLILAATSVSSGSHEYSGTFTLPFDIDFYDEFEVYFQARSVTAGQTTSLTVARIYGRSNDL